MQGRGSIVVYQTYTKKTHPVRVKSVKDPGSHDHDVQHQRVLVAQSQSTAQRPPACNLVRTGIFHSGAVRTMCTSVGEAEASRVTLILCWALSAQWKEAVKTRSRPMKRLLSAKTSATTDHCQLSLEAANRPPARTAPGPGPVSLTGTEDRKPQCVNVCL